MYEQYLYLYVTGELAYHGHRVKIHDSNVANLNSVHLRMEEDKAKLMKEGLLLSKNFVVSKIKLSQFDKINVGIIKIIYNFSIYNCYQHYDFPSIYGVLKVTYK